MKHKHDFRDSWPAPNDYLLEIGRMTSLWGTLESYVNMAISKFAGFEGTLDDRVLIMVAHSNFQQRVDIISSLCAWLTPEYPELKDYKGVISKLKAAQKARNRFAHNAIVKHYNSEDVTMNQASARGSLKTTTEVVRVDDIKEATALIHEGMCSLYALVTGKELKPLWDRDK